MINNAEKISRRCFSNVLIAIKVDEDSTQLSDFENENLIAQLQLLNSVYKENFLEKITILIISSNIKANFIIIDGKGYVVRPMLGINYFIIREQGGIFSSQVHG